jgi:hypothetical protein
VVPRSKFSTAVTVKARNISDQGFPPSGGRFAARVDDCKGNFSRGTLGLSVLEIHLVWHGERRWRLPYEPRVSIKYVAGSRGRFYGIADDYTVLWLSIYQIIRSARYSCFPANGLRITIRETSLCREPKSSHTWIPVGVTLTTAQSRCGLAI